MHPKVTVVTTIIRLDLIVVERHHYYLTLLSITPAYIYMYISHTHNMSVYYILLYIIQLYPFRISD